MKYKLLPDVEELKQIEFKFEHNTLNEVFTYMKQLVKDNRADVVEVILPGLNGTVYDERLEDTKLLSSSVSLEIIKRMARIKQGKIEKSDYYFVTHPRFKNNNDILFNTWKNRLIKYSVDSQIAMYDQTFLGINDDEAIDLVIYNELLRYVILKLPAEEFLEIEDPFTEINFQIDRLLDQLKNYDPKGNRVSIVQMSYQHNLNICYDLKYELIFSGNETVEQKASRIYNKLHKYPNPYEVNRCTSVAEKEGVIRSYLKKQTPVIIKSKNTRGTGKQEAKKKTIIQYISDHPNKTNVEIAKATNSHRDTVSKYRKQAC